MTNPATAEVLAEVPLSGTQEVDAAVDAAQNALAGWSNTPVTDRIQYLFRLKSLLEDRFDDLARIITEECGKTLAESRGELRRGIENVEVACGAPILMQGHTNEDIASGIDELMFRQPVGVCAVITPFNFPAMIPFWFIPYAIACGNTVVCKPSEKVPRTMEAIVKLLAETELPPGVINMVHGARPAVERLLSHPQVKAVSFVGSTPVARSVYAQASANGKRVQAQGGAKNPIIILPDADPEMTTKIVCDSAFGCAGQRCLAASLAITVGGAEKTFGPALKEAALQRIVGNGLHDGVQMGPVINGQSKERIEGLVDRGRLRRCPTSPRRPRRRHSRLRKGELRETHHSGRGRSGRHAGGHRDFRSGSQHGLAGQPGPGDRIRQPGSLRKHGLLVHQQRGQSTAISPRSGGRQYRHQYRSGGPYGLLPVQRLERQLLRRSSRPGAARDRVLTPRQKWWWSAGLRSGQELSEESRINRSMKVLITSWM